MNRRRRATLAAIFETPTRADVRWEAVESLFRALGATVREGEGSRVRVTLNNCRATFHRPHPEPTTGRHTLRDVRDFLTLAGCLPTDD